MGSAKGFPFSASLVEIQALGDTSNCTATKLLILLPRDAPSTKMQQFAYRYKDQTAQWWSSYCKRSASFALRRGGTSHHYVANADDSRMRAYCSSGVITLTPQRQVILLRTQMSICRVATPLPDRLPAVYPAVLRSNDLYGGPLWQWCRECLCQGSALRIKGWKVASIFQHPSCYPTISLLLSTCSKLPVLSCSL